MDPNATSCIIPLMAEIETLNLSRDQNSTMNQRYSKARNLSTQGFSRTLSGIVSTVGHNALTPPSGIVSTVVGTMAWFRDNSWISIQQLNLSRDQNSTMNQRYICWATGLYEGGKEFKYARTLIQDQQYQQHSQEPQYILCQVVIEEKKLSKNLYDVHSSCRGYWQE